MVKFKAKNLVTVIFLGTLLIGLVGIANAQQTLPKGGDSFETAVELKQGSYEGSSLENNEVGYFYVSGIKPGQEINVKGTFTAVSSSSGALGVLGLYSEDRIKLVKELVTSHDKPESFTISWLPNTDEISYKYYILAGSDTFKIASHSLDISLVERYDAGSQTDADDAGDSFEKAMSAVLGEYTAYLSGKLGTDTKDFYNMAVEKGATLTVKVTPPSEAIMEVVIYDGNR